MVLKSSASIALSQILSGAFALERILDPVDDGFQVTDIGSVIKAIQTDNTLDVIIDGVQALKMAGTLGEITISELIEVLKPYVPNLKN